MESIEDLIKEVFTKAGFPKTEIQPKVTEYFQDYFIDVDPEKRLDVDFIQYMPINSIGEQLSKVKNFFNFGVDFEATIQYKTPTFLLRLRIKR